MKKGISKLIRYGNLAPPHIVMENIASSLEKQSKELYHALDNPPLIWEEFLPVLPVRFCIEPICIGHNNSLIICGPSTVEKLSVVRITVGDIPPENGSKDEAEGFLLGSEFKKMTIGNVESFDVTGLPLHSKIIFRKNPLNFIRNEKLFLGYSDTNEEFKFLTIDLRYFNAEQFEIVGNHPLAGHSTAYEGVYRISNDTFYLLSSVTVVHCMNLTRKTWETSTIPEIYSPPFLTVSGTIWKKWLCTLSSRQSQIHFLDLDHLTWSTMNTFGLIQVIARDIHTAKVLGDFLYMPKIIEMNSLWELNLNTGQWKRLETMGMRPLGFTNNTATAILGDHLFCAGYSHINTVFKGQHQIGNLQDRSICFSGPCEIRKICLTKKKMSVNLNAKKRLELIFEDSELSDIEFVVGPDNVHFKAHKVILAGNPVFRYLFLKKFKGDKIIYLDYIPAPEFKAILDHFYFRLDLEQNRDYNIVKLYHVANAFEVIDLKLKLLKLDSILGKLEPEEFISTFLLAIGLSDSPINRELKRKVEKDAHENIQKITTMDNFEEFCAENTEKMAKLFAADSLID